MKSSTWEKFPQIKKKRKDEKCNIGEIPTDKDEKRG